MFKPVDSTCDHIDLEHRILKWWEEDVRTCLMLGVASLCRWFSSDLDGSGNGCVDLVVSPEGS